MRKIVGYLNEPNPHNPKLIDVYRIYREVGVGKNGKIRKGDDDPMYWQTIYVDQEGRVCVWEGHRIKLEEGWEFTENIQNGKVVLCY